MIDLTDLFLHGLLGFSSLGEGGEEGLCIKKFQQNVRLSLLANEMAPTHL